MKNIKTNNKNSPRSLCAVNVALEAIGDHRSLLIIRDIALYGKHTFKEFSQSSEKIATNILSKRLVHLCENGIMTQTKSPNDGRIMLYDLTEKGRKLVPGLLELAGRAATFHETNANMDFVKGIYQDRNNAYSQIDQKLSSGGALMK